MNIILAIILSILIANSLFFYLVNSKERIHFYCYTRLVKSSFIRHFNAKKTSVFIITYLALFCMSVFFIIELADMIIAFLT